MDRLVSRLPTMLELAGMAAICYGLWLVFPPLAFLAGGVFALVVAQGVGR